MTLHAVGDEDEQVKDEIAALGNVEWTNYGLYLTLFGADPVRSAKTLQAGLPAAAGVPEQCVPV
jgi:hypothetical protein